jgi:hypothetical protein
MTDEIKKILEERISNYPFGLDEDVVGLWHIIQPQKKYNLSESETKAHIKDAVLSLMNEGAVPAMAQDANSALAETSVFGSSPQDIASAISSQWPQSATADSIFGINGVWFAAPNYLLPVN